MVEHKIATLSIAWAFLLPSVSPSLSPWACVELGALRLGTLWLNCTLTHYVVLWK